MRKKTRGPSPEEEPGPRRARRSDRDSVDGNAELLGLVDQVVGDAAAREADEALGQEFQQLVVSPERSGPSVCVPVWPADDLVDALRLGPTRRDLFCTRSAAMHEHFVGEIG